MYYLALLLAKRNTGTAAMAPQEIGGVVDGELKVYGTTNLRVVDASIFPNQLAAHPQATVYAIAEKVRAPSVYVYDELMRLPCFV